jgi:transposase
MKLKHKVKVPENEIQQLQEVIRKGEAKVRKITRARVLLLSHEGLKDKEIAKALLIASSTTERIRTRYSNEGLEAT